MRANLLVGCAALDGACGGSVSDLPEDEPIESVSSELTYRPLRGFGRSIHVAEVDLCEAGLELRATGPGDGTRTVSSFASRVGALVAINGGHSWSGAPSVSASGGQFFGRADQGDVGQAVFGPGLADFIHMHTAYARAPGHQEVVSGLLTLVHDGVPQHAVLPNGEYTCSVQHPRTLLGLSADKRRLFMVVVDGRAPAQGRLGMTCGEAADFMVSLGAHWALNLDGGGSSEMVVNGRIVNVPSDGRERPVPTHLAVVRRPGARGHCPSAPVQPPTPPVVQPPATGCGVLAPDASLGVNASVSSCNGRFTFVHQGDGNVVLYDGGRALWSTRTNGRATATLAMQGDGNLVLYAPGQRALWHTRTHGNGGARLVVQDDGNVVLYAPTGRVLWATGTAVATPPPVQPPVTQPPPAPMPPPVAPTPRACGRLGANEALGPNESVTSCDGRFTFVHQSDGNVVLYQQGVARWSSRTAGRASSALVMQGDGNLVLYGPALNPLWSSRTPGAPNALLAVQDDGNVVLYANGQPRWATGTCCR
ncbi:MAG: phosphodiester glycosidase family protein [Myxococcaceae bacterium]|nr:phosphodiester glycosidase family protein [Myxococcaceae bacterium]